MLKASQISLKEASAMTVRPVKIDAVKAALSSGRQRISVHPLHTMGTGSLPGVKGLERGVDRPSPIGPRLKKE